MLLEPGVRILLQEGVAGQGTAIADEDGLRLRAQQVVQQGATTGRVAQQRDEVAGPDERPPEAGVDVRKGHRLIARIAAGDGFVEERRHEGALVDEEAFRRVREEAIPGTAEVGLERSLDAAGHVLLADDRAERLEGPADLRRGPRQPAGDPLVIRLRAALT